MKKNIFIITLFTLALMLSSCKKETEEKGFNSVITPDFSYNEGEIIAGLTPIDFVNKSTATGTEITEFFWHFGFSGEGNWTESETPSSIVYNKSGEYTITLTAWGADGNKASIKKTITVLAANIMPVAAFSYSPQHVTVGSPVAFTDNSSDSDGEIASRLWVFPDGTESKEATPSYTFASVGMQKVTLTVTDDRGESSSTTKSLNVLAESVQDFTVLWETAVGSFDALTADAVVTVSEAGLIYAATGDGALVALNNDGSEAWRYNATAQDNAYLMKEISYPSVDTDGSVFWAAHGYGLSSAASTLLSFDGETGAVRWKNTSAYEQGSRVSYSTPCISNAYLIIGNRGGTGSARAFDKTTGKQLALVTPASGGVNGSIVGLGNGMIVFPVTGNNGFGAMVEDAANTWAAVSTANGFTPGNIMVGNHCKASVDSKSRVFIAGTIKSGTWNAACFDCSSFDASAVQTPIWSATFAKGFKYSGFTLSEDGSTAYIVEDQAVPSIVYALDSKTGSTKWSYTLNAQSYSVPAIDNLGQIHVCTFTGDYFVLSSEGTLVYQKHISDKFEGSISISEWGYAYLMGKNSASSVTKVYAVSLPGVSSPANSAWAQYGQNSRHCNFRK
ncbi:MAG: PKD domain-containing protein [Bacteroidales bacterium]